MYNYKYFAAVFDSESLDRELKHYTIDELLYFQFAFITSIDVKGSFSRFKYLISNRRHEFSFKNLVQNVTLEYNRVCGSTYVLNIKCTT